MKIRMGKEYTSDQIINSGYNFEKMHIDSNLGRYVAKVMKDFVHVANVVDIGNSWWKVTEMIIIDDDKKTYIANISSSYVNGSFILEEKFFSDLDELGEEIAYEKADNDEYNCKDLSGSIFLGIVESDSKENALDLAATTYKLPAKCIEIIEVYPN